MRDWVGFDSGYTVGVLCCLLQVMNEVVYNIQTEHNQFSIEATTLSFLVVR